MGVLMNREALRAIAEKHGMGVCRTCPGISATLRNGQCGACIYAGYTNSIAALEGKFADAVGGVLACQ